MKSTVEALSGTHVLGAYPLLGMASFKVGNFDREKSIDHSICHREVLGLQHLALRKIALSMGLREGESILRR